MGGAIITCVCSPEREQGRILAAVKCWDIIADKQPLAYRLYLKYELRGPTIWVVAAEREEPDALLCTPMTCSLNSWK